MNHTEQVSTELENTPETEEDHGCDHVADDQNGPKRPREIGGRKGLDPVRYGDWEKNGRCIDF